MALLQFAGATVKSSPGLFVCFFFFQVGPKGKVIGIDHIKELVDDSISNVKKDDPSLLTSGRVKLLGEVFRGGKRAFAAFWWRGL